MNKLLLAANYTVFQKSDAKIKITITMAHLIRINYPLSSFNYRLSGTNVANFNKIHYVVSEQQLFTALHGMQTRSCDENSVRPSVRPSVRQTREL